MPMHDSGFSYSARVREWLASRPSVRPSRGAEFAGKRLFFSDSDSSLADCRDFQLQRILDYLQFVVWAEQGVVSEVCSLISANHPYRFSRDLLFGAASIRDQEAEHSRRAYELLVEIFAAEGGHREWSLPSYGAMLECLIHTAPEHADLAKILFVTFVEVVDFETASRLIAEREVAEPIREYAIFHEREEILHRVYFRKLLEELVPQLSEAEGLFAATAIRQLLRSFALNASEPDGDSEESWTKVRVKCRDAIEYLAKTGFLDNQEQRQRFLYVQK